MTSRHADLGGKVVVVTGASKALGAATARAFAENGAKVVCSGRDFDALAEVVASIRSNGGTAIAIAADVTHREQLEALRAAAEREFGPADILLAFAGGGGEQKPTAELSPGRWREVIDANLTSTFETVQVFLGGMLARGHGAIVTMTSAAGRQPAKSNIAYAAAKAGVIQFTRHVAAEVAPHGLRVNCISPSAVENERMHGVMTDDAIAALGKTFPLRRIGVPEDVAEAALYLASESAGWVTGVVLDIAGGKVMV